VPIILLSSLEGQRTSSTTGGASSPTAAVFPLLGRERLLGAFPGVVGTISETLSVADADADESLRDGTRAFAAVTTKKLAMAMNPTDPQTNVTTYSSVRCNKVPPSKEGNFNLAIVDLRIHSIFRFT
jgi:hypothetical protein